MHLIRCKWDQVCSGFGVPHLVRVFCLLTDLPLRLYFDLWQIQDFPHGWREKEGANLLFCQIFPENCMKMKTIGSEGVHPLHPFLDPPVVTVLKILIAL